MYRELAKYYDLFMRRDVDYASLADDVCRFVPPGEGVDFGCGTAVLTALLADRGYKLTGVDVSGGMLTAAAKNVRGKNVTLVQEDIRTFRFMRPADFALAICDTLNYIARPLTAFRNVYSGLKPGGLFVFDVSSAYKLKNILAGRTYSDTENDITYIWQCAMSKGKSVDMTLTFFAPDGQGGYCKSTERQTQYAHTADELLAQLESCGFAAKALGKTRSGGFRAPNGKDERIYFVAKKR